MVTRTPRPRAASPTQDAAASARALAIAASLPEWARAKPAPTRRRLTSPDLSPAAPAAGHGTQSAPLLLTVAQAAQMLTVSTKTVRRMLSRGTLKPVRIGRSVRVRRDQVLRLIDDS